MSLRSRVAERVRGFGRNRRVPLKFRRRVALLERQVKELSIELIDARQQGRRAAEIADLVTELLSNEASRRDPEFVRILERYTGGN